MEVNFFECLSGMKRRGKRGDLGRASSEYSNNPNINLLMPVSVYPNMRQTDIVKKELSNHPYLSKIHQHLAEI